MQPQKLLIIIFKNVYYLLIKEEGGGLKSENAHVIIREGVSKCSRLLTWGKGGSNIPKIMLT